MSDRERLTKAERREIARRERREKEEAEAKAQTRRRVLSTLIAVAAVAGVFSLFWFTREPPPEGDITISETAAEQAFEAAGCEIVPATTTGNAEHLTEPAPSAQQLYQMFPTASGPHLPIVSPVGAFDDPLDERITTHNLEHGAIVVWHEPGYAEADAIRTWVEERNRAGFRRESGAGLIAAPYEQGIGSGKTVAFRAWGNAWDCSDFDQTVADAFTIRYFGSHGQAPEAFFGEYPEGVLTFEGGGEGSEPAPATTDEPTAADDTASPPTEEGSPSGDETASPSPS